MKNFIYTIKKIENKKLTLNIKFAKTAVKRITVFILFVLNLGFITAQENDVDLYKAFNASAHIKNMHIWHGSVVHPGAIFATSLEYNSRNSKFTAGLWGGAGLSSVDVVHNITGESVNANYKELSIYAVYRFSNNFFIEAVSHNNYTGVEERGDKLRYWSYDKTQGYNFVDLNFGVNVSKNTSLYLATILGGGSGDYEVQSNGDLENSYTHYLELKSRVWEKDDNKLSLFIGGAWSFITNKTFYTENKGNIINVGASLNKNINLGAIKIPAEVTAMWNPEQQKAVLQLDITIF
ncbi:hypothetical protein [Lutibacter sp.]|uniref:hypothetical protein n=1 Tax=Lutibacter sp. TaxID=1925666 RepID=UPI003566F7B4